MLSFLEVRSLSARGLELVQWETFTHFILLLSGYHFKNQVKLCLLSEECFEFSCEIIWEAFPL